MSLNKRQTMGYLDYFNNRGRVEPMVKLWICAAGAGLLLLVLSAIFLPPVWAVWGLVGVVGLTVVGFFVIRWGERGP